MEEMTVKRKKNLVILRTNQPLGINDFIMSHGHLYTSTHPKLCCYKEMVTSEAYVHLKAK